MLFLVRREMLRGKSVKSLMHEDAQFSGKFKLIELSAALVHV